MTAGPMAADQAERSGAGRRALAAVLVAVAAFELAVVECFLLPLRIGAVPIPISIPLAVAGNVLLIRAGHRVTRARWGAALPLVVWMAIVVVLSMPRPEGDLIVTGTALNIAYLILGMLSGAFALGRAIVSDSPLTPASDPVGRPQAGGAAAPVAASAVHPAGPDRPSGHSSTR